MTFLDEEAISPMTAELLSPLLNKGVTIKIINFPIQNEAVEKIHLAIYNGKTSHFYFSDSFSEKQVSFTIDNVWRAVS